MASVVLGCISLFLLFQGQRDRRKISADKRAEQAKKVTISADRIVEKEGVNSWRVLGLTVLIRNDSDRPIFFRPMSFVQLYSRPNWSTYRSEDDIDKVWRSKPEELPHTRIDPGASVEIETTHTDVDSARIDFTDAEGNRWVRTSDDGQLFYASFNPTLRSRFYQYLCRAKPLEYVLIKLPVRFATWRFRNTTDGVPLMARVIRFWWGHAPIGEADPWMVPSNAPANDWPFDLWARMARWDQTHSPVTVQDEAEVAE